ncbi:MAG: rod shape-determining protein MreC [Candidatus Pacebacteria bacterium]|nr:rod shape-determining protein MreC [Candidatus Paceibacterota bacterium]
MTPKTTIRTTLILSALLLALGARTVPEISNTVVGLVQPLLDGAALARNSIHGFLDKLGPQAGEYGDGAVADSREERIRELQMDIARYRSAMVENRELRDLLDLPAPPEWRRITAPVTARDPVTWNRRFRIGKGTVHGVRPGVVVTQGAEVIGRVVSATGHSALVVTLADPSCKLSVRLRDAGAVGVLKGRVTQGWHDTPVCVIDYLPRDEDYRAGDQVLTSGLSNIVPPGLRVGSVTQWEPGQTALIVEASYAQVKLRPSALFRDFRYVSVVTVKE